MNKGDIVKLEGYDRVGHADCDYGEVVVLCNNSSHYIVVDVLQLEVVRTENPNGVFVESFAYAGDGAVKSIVAYEAALQCMVTRAVSLSSTLVEADEEYPPEEPIVEFVNKRTGEMQKCRLQEDAQALCDDPMTQAYGVDTSEFINEWRKMDLRDGCPRCQNDVMENASEPDVMARWDLGGRN